MNKEIERILQRLNLGSELTPNEFCYLKEYIKNLQNQVNTINNNNEELKRRLKIVQQKRDTHKAVRYRLQNNRDKAIEVINTQLKNAEGGAKDNLRIIKFNLIKGSCTFEDLKTEEDYKYILKGDSDE